MQAQSIRLALILPDLSCGGIQRASVTMTQELARRGYIITVFTFGDDRADFFPLPPGVPRVSLELKSAGPTPVLHLVGKTLQRLRALRSAVLAAHPDVVVAHATQVNVQTLLALQGAGLPIIVTEHGDVSTTKSRKSLWYRLRRTTYRLAFKVVSVNAAADRNVSWLPQERRTIIANAIVPPTAPATNAPSADASLHAAGGDFIISMGRLAHAKGFDILIEAFARIAADFPQWKLVILGDGELRTTLEQQAAARGLRERILFVGAVADPASFLRRARLFVMASRFEGFPLAHGEALACGLPVIATDCPSGPASNAERIAGGVRELLRRNVDGVLVPCEDPSALAHAMADLMADRLRREVLAEHASQVLSRFSPDRIFDAWDRLLREAVHTSR
jgi:GalNAc-alpha-(1->4)-GalNAc-alpha-(1->3)-diNAcBac-PP-undecaprenol alpha-1,4-N-acetyl-D-galactosaminyltransferase